MPLYGKVVVIRRTGIDGAHYPVLVQKTTFGRSNDCDIRVQLPNVSKEHCRITVEPTNKVFLTNFSREIPTLLNGSVVDVAQLHHMDVFTIIDRNFRWEFPPGSPQRTVPLPPYRSSSKQTFTAKKVNRCTLCGYSSNRKYRLKEHLRIHSGERPYECKHCTYAAAYSQALRVHLRTHSSRKPYKCSYCRFKTKYAAVKREHERTHQGEMPYKCSRCKYMSSSHSNLRRHKRIHTVEKPYMCPSCGESYKWPSSLKKHTCRK